MFDRGERVGVVFAVALLLVALTSPARGNVNLEFRPASQEVCPNEADIVAIGLYAVSDVATDQPFASLAVILWWDETQLELLGHFDTGPYTWLGSGFEADEQADRLNDDCGDDCFWNEQSCTSDDDCANPAFFPCNMTTGMCPHTGRPFNDGDAWYFAWRQFPPGVPPDATPAGLLVTEFRFRLLGPAGEVAILPQYGSFSETHVIGLEGGGEDVTGVIGAPALISGCLAPTAVAEGPRYLAVTPDPSCTVSVALAVTGNPSDPTVSCVDLYVQADGTLGATRVEQTPAQWGTVHVRGGAIRPSTTYTVQADCASVPTVRSDGVSATTWAWGDVNNANQVDLDDILSVLDGFQGVFFAATRQNVDLFGGLSADGCPPDEDVSLDDVLSVLDAFRLLPFPCDGPC